MNFIHIADTHLGKTAFNKLADDGSNLRETLIDQNFLDGIEYIATEVQPDILVHSGDLFDTVRPKTKTILVAMQALDILKENHIPLVIVAGNHEMQKNAYTVSAFEILKKAHPEINAAYSFRYENFLIGGVVFHCIPNMLHAADYKKASDEALHWVKSGMYGNLHIDNHVLVTHGLATTIRDKRLATCAEFELTPEILSETYDYIALGHYHGQQQIAPNAWYSGSQEHLTYGEIDEKKGALNVTIENGITTVNHLSLVRSPMKDLGIINCEGVSMDDILDAIDDEVGLLDGREDQMYQITLDFGDSPIVTLPPDALKDIREGILDLKIRVKSNEIARQQIQQQDLKTINYVNEFETFLQKQPGKYTGYQEAVKQRGVETLKTVIAQHSEITE